MPRVGQRGRHPKTHPGKAPQEGEGIIRDITHFFTGREPGEKAVNELLSKHGSATITGIYVYRKPIESYIRKILSVLTLGKFESAVKSAGYDKLFHLFMNINLSDGYSFGIEKNESVKITHSFDRSGAEFVKVPVTKNVTLSEFIMRGINSLGKKSFYDYSAFTHNCQEFLTVLLQSSGLLTPEIRKFINQDAQSILRHLPGYTSKLANLITDIAGSVGSVISGNGIEED